MLSSNKDLGKKPWAGGEEGTYILYLGSFGVAGEAWSQIEEWGKAGMVMAATRYDADVMQNRHNCTEVKLHFQQPL